jgi:hypothetical protein
MFAAKDLSMGELNALVKICGGEDSVRAILSGKVHVQLIESSRELAEFFTNRPGLWVDIDLERCVGFANRKPHRTAALKRRTLSFNKSETQLFGAKGTKKHALSLENATDLGQIKELIEAQEGGIAGVLLNNGEANIFTVIGRNGELYCVIVRWIAGVSKWFVFCFLFGTAYASTAGSQVFSN